MADIAPLVVKDLYKTFNENEVLKGVSIEAHKGDVISMIGSSGSGKSAFQSVDNGQIEAGKAYGMSRRQIFLRISFPQMMRHALPGLGNNWQVLLKTTALVSVIGLTDMVRVATEASKAEHAPFKFFIPVAVIYLALTWVSEFIIRRLDAKYSVGVLKH